MTVKGMCLSRRFLFRRAHLYSLRFIQDEKTPNDEPEIAFAHALPVEDHSPVPATTTESSPSATTIPSGAPAPAPAGGVYHLPNMGRQPKSIKCPNCHQDTQTEISHQVDAYTIVFCIVILFLFWPLFWLVRVMMICYQKCCKQNCLSFSYTNKSHPIILYSPLSFLRAKRQYIFVPNVASN